MLLFMADRDPLWGLTANENVASFLQHPEKRSKVHNPCLGRFLINLLLSDRGWDDEIASAYFQESLARQVSWFLTNNKKNVMSNAYKGRESGTASGGQVNNSNNNSNSNSNINQDVPPISPTGKNRVSSGSVGGSGSRRMLGVQGSRIGIQAGGMARDRIVNLSGPAAAQSLEFLSTEYDNRRGMSFNGEGYNHVGNESVYDDDAPDGCSVISSSNMHEYEYRGYTSRKGSTAHNSSNTPNTMKASTNGVRARSYIELAQLETDPVCAYRLVTTFEVKFVKSPLYLVCLHL